MTIAIVLPRNMHFGPQRATSIDLVVHDAVRYSRFQGETVIVCQETDALFEGFEIRTYAPGGRRARIRQIAGLLKEAAPSLIVVHQHLPSATALARRFPDIPVLLHKHNFIEGARRFRLWRRNRQLNHLAGVIFVSEACRQDFIAGYPGFRGATFVAHNGLPVEDWPRAPEKAQEIVAVGRVEKRKGQIEIAEALRAVLPDYPEWRARFIGPLDDGEELGKAFKARIHDIAQIEWQGAAPFVEVIAATRRASIAVVNSRQEAFGRVAIEAFAGETALISTRVGGLDEVIGSAASVLEEGTADEIAAHLRQLLDDDALRFELARAGRERFEACFTPARTAAQLDAAYEMVL